MLADSFFLFFAPSPVYTVPCRFALSRRQHLLRGAQVAATYGRLARIGSASGAIVDIVAHLTRDRARLVSVSLRQAWFTAPSTISNVSAACRKLAAACSWRV